MSRKHVPGDVRRRQILDTAAELFAERGFAGTTTREIAKAVGTSETVLFRHFPTKERLYAAILEHQVPVAEVRRWVDELRKIADRRDDEALFAAVARAVLRSYRENATYHRLMLFAALENHKLARIGHTKYAAPVARFLREYVAQRQAEGVFTRLQPAFVVHTFLSVVGHYAMWNALGVNSSDLTEQDLATQVVALVARLRSRR